jgi:uncharacterized membrane protein YeaQ/YmgE (transglycosylase-associated protein family)
MIGALILGLLAGAIGRALVPNDAFQGMRGPKSWLVSIVLGLVGAALGWAIFTAGLGIGDEDMFDLGGLLSALIGVVIVLLLPTSSSAAPATTPRPAPAPASPAQPRQPKRSNPAAWVSFLPERP